ncbi:GIY-YIG nuclease family protein [Liberiplasma polymorphum]|uniref:GIY-YIG nuclease family protein n=1 Tax=Liberiplasma polymorphum TaxID=3374570 RepID=UPI0037720221
MISLTNILGIRDSDIKSYKVHFAIGKKHNPMDEYLLGKFKEYQEIQTRPNFKRKYIISLIYSSKSVWMFAGVYEVLGTPTSDNNSNEYKYATKLIDVQTDLIGRLYFKYDKAFRQSYPNLETILKKSDEHLPIEVLKLEEFKHTIRDFPGFDNVKVSYEVLKTIVEQDISSWKATLSKAKGIYLIVDSKTGKHYVGSASGDEAIWNRWVDYVKNGHGGNKGLKDVIEVKGLLYAHNFQFSILEISNLNTSDLYIYERESHWKDVLLSREFGLNHN